MHTNLPTRTRLQHNLRVLLGRLDRFPIDILALREHLDYFTIDIPRHGFPLDLLAFLGETVCGAPWCGLGGGHVFGTDGFAVGLGVGRAGGGFLFLGCAVGLLLLGLAFFAGFGVVFFAFVGLVYSFDVFVFLVVLVVGLAVVNKFLFFLVFVGSSV